MMDHKKMCAVHMVAWELVLVGALNWGLIGLLNFNLVDWLLGSWPLLMKVVYILIGLSAIALLLKKKCTKCMVGGEKKKDEKPAEMPKAEEGSDKPEGGM